MNENAREHLTDVTDWLRFDSLEDHRQHRRDHESLWGMRALWSETLHQTLSSPGQVSGRCGACEAMSLFCYEADTEGINTREALVCSHCQLNARQRAVWAAMQATFPTDRRWAIYLTEQASHFYKAAKHRWPGIKGSEYFPKSGFERLSWYVKHLMGQHEILRWEDVCRLSLKNRSVDGIVCLEVLEHVPNYQDALREFARVIKPDGQLMITVPFLDDSEHTLVRARITESGQIEHLCEPEYHGDPVDGQGILAYYHFGWDLLDTLKSVGFSKAQWCLPWSPAMGLYDRLWTLIATR